MTEDKMDSIGYDTAKDEQYRVYASVSFAILLLGIGVPLWWHTTTVPRVPLPYAGIERLSHLEVKIKIKLVIGTFTQRRAESLARDISTAFQDNDIYQIEILTEIIPTSLMDTTRNYLEMEEKIATPFHLKAGQLLLLENNHYSNVVFVGYGRTLFFGVETAGSTLIRVLSEWILREKSLALTKTALTEPTIYSLDEENRRRFPPSPAYDVSITLVNPDPEKFKVAWDVRRMVEGYFQPFLDQLSLWSNFSVKSQWLYLLPFDVNPKRIPDSGPLGRHFALPEDFLPHLITPFEKKLASQVSLHPTINFVIYVVPCYNAPLHIYTRSGNRSSAAANVEAFLSPRWGGVVLVNPPLQDCAAANADRPVLINPNESTIVGTLLAQLKLLLGIPEPRFFTDEYVGIAKERNLKLRDWEVDALLRVRTIEQLISAKLTLQSLAKLLQEIGNIVITDDVGDRIKTALSLAEMSAEHLTNGNLDQAFLLSKEAFVAAEAAFSDPTLLALLYFPEDQKYAVYIPLFLPAMIPVLLSLKNIYRHYYSTVRKDRGTP